MSKVYTYGLFIIIGGLLLASWWVPPLSVEEKRKDAVLASCAYLQMSADYRKNLAAEDAGTTEKGGYGEYFDTLEAAYKKWCEKAVNE